MDGLEDKGYMPISMPHNISSFGARCLLEPNTAKIGGTVKHVANDIKVNRGSNDTVSLPVSKKSSTGAALMVTIENLSAADSAFREMDIAKEIAILTKNYILETAPVAMDNKPIYRLRYQPDNQ